MRLRLLSSLPVLAVLSMTACGSTEEPTPTPPIAVPTVGSAGGTVLGQGAVDGVQVVIPFGALAQDTPIAVGEDPEPPAPPVGFIPASAAVLCSPEGLTFQRPVTLLIPYRGLSDVALYTAPAIAGAPWQPFDGGSADTAQNLMRASVTHFSRWRVFRRGTLFPDGGY